MFGPDLPTPTEPFTSDAYESRWPTGATKSELIDGALIFTGQFDERDLTIAARAYADRRVQLGPDGGIEVYPSQGDWTIWDQWGGVEAARAAMKTT